MAQVEGEIEGKVEDTSPQDTVPAQQHDEDDLQYERLLNVQLRAEIEKLKADKAISNLQCKKEIKTLADLLHRQDDMLKTMQTEHELKLRKMASHYMSKLKEESDKNEVFTTKLENQLRISKDLNQKYRVEQKENYNTIDKLNFKVAQMQKSFGLCAFNNLLTFWQINRVPVDNKMVETYYTYTNNKNGINKIVLKCKEECMFSMKDFGHFRRFVDELRPVLKQCYKIDADVSNTFTLCNNLKYNLSPSLFLPKVNDPFIFEPDLFLDDVEIDELFRVLISKEDTEQKEQQGLQKPVKFQKQKQNK